MTDAAVPSAEPRDPSWPADLLTVSQVVRRGAAD
jgi:hypothetical protein